MSNFVTIEDLQDVIERLSAENEALESKANLMFHASKQLGVSNAALRARIAQLESGQPVEVRGEPHLLVQREIIESIYYDLVDNMSWVEMQKTLGAMLTASAQSNQPNKIEKAIRAASDFVTKEQEANKQVIASAQENSHEG